MEKKKIMNLSALAALIHRERASGKKVVHCHGVFDLLHIGHIRHFEQAKRHGDILVVSITQDQHVNKGPDRPVFNENFRAEAVAALSCVDYVAISPWKTAVEVIRQLKPDFYAKGPDYQDPSKDRTGGIVLEKEAAEAIGGKLIFTQDATFSSSHLINQRLPVLPKEASDFIQRISHRHSADQFWDYFENARKLKVLVMGETIIDEYEYCESLGKAGKEPILAVRYSSSERFAGGILAVANIVASFCDNVTMLSFLGSYDRCEEFIRESLSKNIHPIFLTMNNAPTIVKRRFVELYPFQKLFEVYVMKDDQGDPELTKSLNQKLEEILPYYDVVIVADYGHGMIEADTVELLCQQAKFLAVNTQVNAGNRGFNVVSKFNRADYICVSENELRLEARNRAGDLEGIVNRTAEKLCCNNMVITRGRHGCLCFRRGEGFIYVPALTSKFEDRIGAGDAVFGVTALLVAQGVPMDAVGLVGNAVGAEVVSTVGHRHSIDRIRLYKHIEALLK